MIGTPRRVWWKPWVKRGDYCFVTAPLNGIGPWTATVEFDIEQQYEVLSIGSLVLSQKR